MHQIQETLAALAGADRADVTLLPGKTDGLNSTPSVLDLQVRNVMARCAVSISLAVVIAEVAFSSGRQA